VTWDSLRSSFTAENTPKPLVAVTVVAVAFYLVVPTGGGDHGESAFRVAADSLELGLLGRNLEIRLVVIRP
jgi:hypothetical protein